MAQTRLFPDNTTQLVLSDSIAALLKEKFNLYGEIANFPLTRDGKNLIMFQMPDQGHEETATLSRGQRATDFIKAICAEGTVTISYAPTRIHPEYYPHEKVTHIEMQTSQLERVKTALELMCKPAPQGSAMFARC